jgi:DNA processing protein
MSAEIDLVALSLLPASRARRVAEQLKSGTSPGAVLEEHSTVRADGRGRPVDARELRQRAVAALARAERAGIRSISRAGGEYPPLLSAISDPPPVIWIRGDPAILDRPAVAIVGSRAGSPYALLVAERLGFELAQRGVLVVSGMARGVDGAAHRGALAGGGPTLAVLGSGVDVIYPVEHAALARDIASSGVVMSELAPGTPPLAPFFPRRNRIISGLSRGVVIVEAGEKSGSLITARCALEQGRDVLAVPGNILNDRNRGGHALLRDGARLAESADDILEELGIARSGGLRAVSKMPARSADTLGRSRTDPLLECLAPGESCDLDDLASRSGLAPVRLLPRLLELELQGLVRRAGGGRFVRVDSSC